MLANDPGAARRPAAGHDDVEGRVRARLRALRLRHGLTLAQAAAAAGMDASALSRLESGARRLTLAHLPPLARALGVSAADLLAPALGDDGAAVRSSAGTGGAGRGAGHGGRAHEARPWRTPDGVAYVPVGAPAADGMQTCRILLPDHLRDARPRTHAGHKWLHVLGGRMRLVLGREERVLAPGEAAQFSTWTPHWSGVVDEPVELLATFRP